MFITLLLTLLFLSSILYVIYYPPIAFFNYMQLRHPSVLYHLPLPPTHRIVALTIDDAPSAYTSQLLDILSAYAAHATFFLIGDQITPSLAPLLPRMISEGHEVGNHCWTDEKTVLRSLEEIETQVLRVEKLLPENENKKKWFRPGGGFYTTQMVERVKEMGYRTALGCIYPHDPQVWSARLNARHVLSMVREGGVIIMHDRRKWSVKQVELALRGLKEKGYRVVSLGELVDVWEELNGKGRS